MKIPFIYKTVIFLGFLAVISFSFKVGSKSFFLLWDGYRLDNEDFLEKCGLSYEDAVKKTEVLSKERGGTWSVDYFCPRIDEVQRYATGGIELLWGLILPFIVICSTIYLVAVIIVIKILRRKAVRKNQE
jgi:hypothetical protein